jgi:hypothetical protein
MNERQRDLFLWQWSKRRTPGRHAIGLRGAAIGALGGVLFGLLLAPGPDPDVHAYDFLGQLLSGFRVYVLSIPALAAIGWSGARRVFASHEAMYQSLLAQGARVPEQKPVMQARDRGPAIAVGIAVAVIAGFILFVAIKLG